MAAALLVVLGQACGRITPLTFHLPTDPTWNGKSCLGTGLNAVLHGSQADSRLAWANDAVAGVRFNLVWPAGYTATFDPKLEVLDPGGTVVGREGYQVIGGCVTDSQVVYRVNANDLMAPP